VRTSGSKLSTDHIIPGYIGMAVRLGSGDLTTWLNEAVKTLTDSDFFLKSLSRNESKPEAQAALKGALPYPGHPMPIASADTTPSESCELLPNK
jgi:hypothetical protein